MILSAKTSSFESFNASSTFQTMFLLSMMLWLVVLNVQYMFQLNTERYHHPIIVIVGGLHFLYACRLSFI